MATTAITVYLPLYLTCGEHVLRCRLRRADGDASDGAVEELTAVVAQIRQSCSHRRSRPCAPPPFALPRCASHLDSARRSEHETHRRRPDQGEVRPNAQLSARVTHHYGAVSRVWHGNHGRTAASRSLLLSANSSAVNSGPKSSQPIPLVSDAG